jgi:hypothetical protein
LSRPTLRSAPAGALLGAPLLLAALLGGCAKEEVSHYKVPREQPAPPTAAAPAPAPGMAGDVAAPPRPDHGLRWKLPKGWTEAPAGSMRYATLKPPVKGKIDVSVTVLPGPAGGELANVNRWRNQIGLGPLDEAALAKARKVVKSAAGAVSLYDFAGSGDKGSRMIAGLLLASDGNSWFLKMVGDDAPTAAARPDFLAMLESLRLE